MNELMALKENMLQVQYIIESNNVSNHTHFPTLPSTKTVQLRYKNMVAIIPTIGL